MYLYLYHIVFRKTYLDGTKGYLLIYTKGIVCFVQVFLQVYIYFLVDMIYIFITF